MGAVESLFAEVKEEFIRIIQDIVDTAWDPGSTSETILFYSNFVVLIGWITLIFNPKSKTLQGLLLYPTLFLCSLYSILFLYTSTNGGSDFFTIDGWMKSMSQRTNVMAATYHFSAMDLMTGSIIAADFLANFEQKTVPRIIVSLILLMSYIICPAGYLTYNVAKVTVLKKHRLLPPDKDPRFMTNTKKLEAELTDAVPSGHPIIDSLPPILKHAALFLCGVAGIALLLFMLTVYLVYVVSCVVLYTLTLHGWGSIHGKFWPFPAVVVISARLRQFWVLTAKHNWFLRLVLCWLPYLLEFSFFVEFLPFGSDPTPFVDFLVDKFGPTFPFGDGIGFANYADVKKHLEDPNIIKGPESLAWRVSTSQYVYSKFTPPYYPQKPSQEYIVHESREVTRAWLEPIPQQLSDFTKGRLDALLVPSNPDGTILSDALLERTFGDTLFHLLTGGELTREERDAYNDNVNNIGPFLPNWINFMAAGWFLERKGIKGYNTIRDALLRYPASDCMMSAIHTARALNWESGETVRLLTTAFAIAGAAAPAKLTSAVVRRLFENPEENVKQYRKNKMRYIKETARLDRGVPIVNMFSHQEGMTVTIGGKDVEVPVGTPLHASIVNANKDTKVFGPDAKEFNMDRPSLLSILTWNGTESIIMEDDKNLYGSGQRKRKSKASIDGNRNEALPPGDHPPRRCPGHSVALMIIEFLVDRYLPKPPAETITQERFVEVNDSQTTYTKLLLAGSKTYINQWNATPPRAAGALYPGDAVQKPLGEAVLPYGASIPTYDEDDPPNPLVPIVGNILQARVAAIYDPNEEWASADEGEAWRIKMFGSMFPPVNIKYPDLSSIDHLSQFGFSGIVGFRTKKVEAYKQDSTEFIKKPDDAVYVNSNLELGQYKVRDGFHAYGAAAYFDKDCKICGIYTHFDKSLATPPKGSKAPSPQWKHATWVWKVSGVAMVTVIDHLINTHLVESNALTYASRKHLAPDHPVRAFLKIFTYRTVSINWNASMTLTCRKGLVERIWAFEGDDLQNMFKGAYDGYKFVLVPDRIDESMRDVDDSHYPLNHDVAHFWEIVRTMVHEVLLNMYHSEKEMLKDQQMTDFLDELAIKLRIQNNPKFNLKSLDGVVTVLTNLACVVTGYHEHVGQVSDYFTNPSFCGTTLRKGMEIDTIQTYSLKCALVSLTGLRVARLLGNWEHLMIRARHGDEVIGTLGRFYDNLRSLSLEIMDRNKNKRQNPLQSFDALVLESSVSI